VVAARTLCMQYRQEWQLPEHCAYSRDRSGSYQNTVHAVETGVVAARTLCME